MLDINDMNGIAETATVSSLFYPETRTVFKVK